MSYFTKLNEELIREDGYIDVTLLCKIGGKEFKHWKENKTTKLYIKSASQIYNLDESELIETGKGKNYHSWVHPIIATNIAQWISSEFAVHISKWIEDWKKANIINENEYNNKLENIKGDKNNEQKEKEIQEKLYEKLGGIKEYETKYGNIDLLTESEVIEIKIHENWKHGLGQLLVYSNEIKNKKLRLHLFDGKKEEDIINICKVYNINVSWE